MNSRLKLTTLAELTATFTTLQAEADALFENLFNTRAKGARLETMKAQHITAQMRANKAHREMEELRRATAA